MPVETLFLLLISLTGFVLLALIYFPHLFSSLPFVEPAEINGLLDSGQDMVVLDIRGPDEFDGPLGRIPGAVNIPGWQLQGKIKDIEADLERYRTQPVVVVCRVGIHAPRAARMLKKAGLEKVMVLKGGMKRWNREALPIEV